MSTTLDAAMAFLADALADGPVASAEIVKRAARAGIAKRTLERAKQRIGATAHKLDLEGGWVWQLADRQHGALGREQGERSPNAVEKPQHQQALEVTASTAPADPPSATPPDFDPIAYQAAWTARRLGPR